MAGKNYELPIFYVPCTNGEATTCPPYGVCEVQSVDEDTGFAVIGKPTADGTGTVFFNGPTAIPPGFNGQMTQSFPALAAYLADSADGTDPAHAETWGTESGSWYLHLNQPGFKIIGDGAQGICNVQRSNWQDDLKLLPSYNASVVQFLYHDASGVLDWFDTEEC